MEQNKKTDEKSRASLKDTGESITSQKEQRNYEGQDPEQTPYHDLEADDGGFDSDFSGTDTPARDNPTEGHTPGVH